jgi:hypothetical protein
MSKTSNVMQMTPGEAKDAVIAAYHSKDPVFLLGEPGVGKSAVVKQAAETLGIDIIDLRLVQLEAVDLRGLPFKTEIEHGGKAHVVMSFAATSILPREGRGILFLDEFAQASTMVQNAASELLLDRTCGEYSLPDGWLIVCASNRRTDRAGTTEIPTHIRNRCCFIEVGVSQKEWLRWASGNGVSPHVIAYIKANPKRLQEFGADATAFPSPRSWVFVSNILKGPAKGKIREGMIHGCIGEGAGTELTVFLERTLELPTYEDVIADPANVPIPSKSNLSFNLIGMVAHTAVPKDVDAVLTFLARFPPEETKFAMTMMAEEKPEFGKLAKFNAFFKELSGKEQVPA